MPGRVSPHFHNDEQQAEIKGVEIQALYDETFSFSGAYVPLAHSEEEAEHASNWLF